MKNDIMSTEELVWKAKEGFSKQVTFIPRFEYKQELCRNFVLFLFNFLEWLSIEGFQADEWF